MQPCLLAIFNLLPSPAVSPINIAKSTSLPVYLSYNSGLYLIHLTIVAFPCHILLPLTLIQKYYQIQHYFLHLDHTYNLQQLWGVVDKRKVWEQSWLL